LATIFSDSRLSLTSDSRGGFMAQEEDIRQLVARWCAGDQEAARLLVERYSPYLRQVIRQRLHPRLRTQFDSLDFTQDVWASFFASPPAAEDFASAQRLLAFLTALARNKVISAVRQRLQRQKYNLKKEEFSLDAPGVQEPPSPQPTPSVIVMSQEEWQRLLGRQPLVYRRVLILWREGRSSSQIAQEVGISERTVRRVLRKLLPGTRP
jgi:RNA polymerase sigma-70 factor (ECF subfamily)